MIARNFKRTKRGTPKFKPLKIKTVETAGEFVRIRQDKIVNEGYVWIKIILEDGQEIQVRFSEQELENLKGAIQNHLRIYDGFRSGKIPY